MIYLKKKLKMELYLFINVYNCFVLPMTIYTLIVAGYYLLLLVIVYMITQNMYILTGILKIHDTLYIKFKKVGRSDMVSLHFVVVPFSF